MKTLFSMLNCGHFHHLDCFFFFRLPPGKKLRINKCRGEEKPPGKRIQSRKAEGEIDYDDG
jgi:hypothetical protein